jgi:hypothetical protein
MRAAIKRLKLTVPRHELAAPAQWAVEEAIRLSGRDGGERLVVIRKLALGRLTPGLNARVDAQLRALINGAAPAASPQSAAAEAVWFDTPEAARALLVEQLLSGATPFAWFWRQAVPDWRAGSSADPLSHIKHLMATPQGRIALAPVLLRLVSEGRAGQLAIAMAEAAAEELLAIWPGRAATQNRPDAAAPMFRPIPQLPALAAVLAKAAALWQPNSARAQWLAFAVLPAFAPHLAAIPGAALLAAAAKNAADAPPARHQLLPGQASMAASADHPSGTIISPELARTPGAPHPEQVPRASHGEERSVAAGLFLLIGPLRFLGFEAWLARNPRAAAAGYGVALLRAIAARHGIAADDPVWTHLSNDDGEPPDTTPWRVGLARMLRRRCRLKLGDVVRRPGWLSGGAGALEARFPSDEADIRLRRMAFDLDPGFVPWLGLTAAYRYEDRHAP